MSVMTAEAKEKFFSPGAVVVTLIAIIGVVLALYRFFAGIGSVANLNNAYPWGFWIGFDVLAGIALAAGGFTLTAAVYVWQNKKYHAVARPAVLTAFLGYVIFVGALMVDLGRYYRIWHVLWPSMWQRESVMFEVGWCVATYLTVLFFEFLPIIFEKFGRRDWIEKYHRYMPLITILMLTVFTAAMAHHSYWVLIIFGLLILFELLRWIGMIPSQRGVVTLLIFAGVVLSCLHQSSLGSVFLIVPHKLSHLWWSPILPLLFVTSAIAVGPAMVIFEGLVSGRVFRHPSPMTLMRGLGRAVPVLLGIYLTLRIGDLVARNAIWLAFEKSPEAIMFWVEILVGALIPITLLATPEVRESRAGLFLGSLCVVVGVIVNRLNVAIVGIAARGWETYVPAVSEIIISAGIVCIGLLAFRYFMLYYPVLEGHSSESAPGTAGA